MSKKGMLRNGETDLQKFTQWIGRKIKNHDPLSELDIEPRKDRFKRVVKALPDGSAIIVRCKNGRRFEISVREMGADEPVRTVVNIGS